MPSWKQGEEEHAVREKAISLSVTAVSQFPQAWSLDQGLSLAFCSLLAIFLLLLLDPHYHHLRMPKIGAYLMLFDIFKGPRSMLLWSEKLKANINRHTTGLKWKHTFTPPIKTPGETGVLRQL